MKREKVIILFCVILVLAAFSACDKSNKKTGIETTGSNETTAGVHVHMDENGETYTHADSEEHNEGDVTTNNSLSAISESEAMEKIQNFSEKKLGLDGKKKDYSFLAATKKKKISGKKYIEIIASVMKKNKKNDTVSIDARGTYYVSEDGKKCLIKDMETGKTKELK